VINLTFEVGLVKNEDIRQVDVEYLPLLLLLGAFLLNCCKRGPTTRIAAPHPPRAASSKERVDRSPENTKPVGLAADTASKPFLGRPTTPAVGTTSRSGDRGRGAQRVEAAALRREGHCC
jgi:hypothetical protein